MKFISAIKNNCYTEIPFNKNKFSFIKQTQNKYITITF